MKIINGLLIVLFVFLPLSAFSANDCDELTDILHAGLDEARRVGAISPRGVKAYFDRVVRKNGQGSLKGEIPATKRFDYVPEDQIKSHANQGEIREIQAGDILGRDFDVERLPDGNTLGTGGGEPDVMINGEVFDIYSPKSDNPFNVFDTVRKKVPRQAHRVVVYLADSDMKIDDILEEFYINLPITKIDDLKELIIIDKSRVIEQYFPF